jgi:hypothetical protein
LVTCYLGDRLGTSRLVDRLELWGGVECTVNRVGDAWFDQTPRSGHQHRIEDLNLFAELGMSSLRYPAVWERISPDSPEARDWRWTDERLPRLRELELNPILTLCHHGSGPHYTEPAGQDGFAAGFAASHAGRRCRSASPGCATGRRSMSRSPPPVQRALRLLVPHTTDEGCSGPRS